MPAGYTVCTWAGTSAGSDDVALTAATAKTVLAVVNGTNALIRLTEFGISFDGTSATNEPVTVELCSSTLATTGTRTTETPLQIYGSARTVQATAFSNYTAESTVLAVWKVWLVHPQTGITVVHPLGREVEQVTTADGLMLRCESPAAVNCRAYMTWEEG